MTTHITARLAWHMDGWNGHICKNPKANTYCVGCNSYPGAMIAEDRPSLFDWEVEHAGKPLGQEPLKSLPQIPPCCYGVNAFGHDTIRAYADPPDFFNDGTERREWTMLPATICTWPYEEMYADDVKQPNGQYDYARRLVKAKAYFEAVERDASLVVYYANYSNPFSEEEKRRYVIVGISRVKQVGEIMNYEGCSDRVKERYAGGFIWQCPITSHYPEQGVRIPYHRYLDRPDVLPRLLVVPENARNCKFATRHITDDDALGVVERLLEVVRTLIEIGDTSEDWEQRKRWLQGLGAELWRNRGLYPGMPKLLRSVIRFEEAVEYFRKRALAGEESDATQALFDLLDGRKTELQGLSLSKARLEDVRRQWRLLGRPEQDLARNRLIRFDLREEQFERVLSPKRAANCLSASAAEMTENPYVIGEQFVGEDPDDIIPVFKIDHGMMPSPDLGGERLCEPNDWRRFRAFCVDRLKWETEHCFVSGGTIVNEVNRRLESLPEWKRQEFTEQYLEADAENLAAAIFQRDYEGQRYLYLRTTYEDERHIEQVVRELAGRPDIPLRTPVTEEHWKDWLRDPESVLRALDAAEYERAVEQQAQVCSRLFKRPVCILSGEAGTGKTTVVRAIISAIERTGGTGSAVVLLAPTGKAADRLRVRSGRDASTVHSFLAKNGWLNQNLTFKRSGGQAASGVTTLIVDEASMLDLALAATLFRAVKWKAVQRLILVGDPNQLPPIGRGRVFKDLIDWLAVSQRESLGRLAVNVRQMENRVRKAGTGILDLASLYVQADQQEIKDEGASIRAEALLQRVQSGGDVDKDLRVIYWRGAEDLSSRLTATIVADMERDSGQRFNSSRPYELWKAAFTDADGSWNPDLQQVIAPYRGDEAGTDAANTLLQSHRHGRVLEHGNHVEGITTFDKVIQVRNRTKSDPILAYNFNTRLSEAIELFNGELGFVQPHPFDKGKRGRLKRFHVRFARKTHLGVGYGEAASTHPKGWPISEPVEGNLELAYAISVHKAQGSEFTRVYFIVPKHRARLLSSELFYTGMTRAKAHCTLLIEEDIAPLLWMRRPEKSRLRGINSSLFSFKPLPSERLNMATWYEEGRIHQALCGEMVRSKSEVIIANLLTEREIEFKYEVPLFAPDGTMYLPDFTIKWHGEDVYWEHLGRMDKPEYRAHWETKRRWYDRHFPGRLMTTEEGPTLSKSAEELIRDRFS